MGQSPFSLILANTSLEKRVQNNKKKNTSIFSDMVEIFFEVFMDDFSVYGDSYELCLMHLGKSS
jgi:hypothetical protein